MREICTGTDSFKKVNTRGFPTAPPKEQPWMKLVSGQKKSEAGALDKMVVVCSLTHDYGWSPFPPPTPHLTVTQAAPVLVATRLSCAT